MYCVSVCLAVLFLSETTKLGPGICGKFLPRQTGCTVGNVACSDTGAAVGQNCSNVPYITQISTQTWDKHAPATTTGYWVWNVDNILCYKVAACKAQLDMFGVRFCGPDLNTSQDVVRVKWDMNTDNPCDVSGLSP